MLNCIRGTALFVLLAVILNHSASLAEDGRPGLALTLKLEGDVAKVTIAFDYLQTDKALPKNIGVRQYTYDVPVGGGVTQVGWDKGKEVHTVVLRGKKFTYRPADTDRRENGSFTVTKETDPQFFRIQGVYHYSDHLFVIDNAVAPGVSLLLFEEPAK